MRLNRSAGTERVGQEGDDPALLDLEAYGAVSVAGPPPHLDAFLRSVAVQLAGSEDLADADVLTVGVDAGIDALDRITATTMEMAATALTRAAELVTDSLKTSRRPDTFHARTGASIPIEATVVVANGLDASEVSGVVTQCPARYSAGAPACHLLLSTQPQASLNASNRSWTP